MIEASAKPGISHKRGLRRFPSIPALNNVIPNKLSSYLRIEPELSGELHEDLRVGTLHELVRDIYGITGEGAYVPHHAYVLNSFRLPPWQDRLPNYIIVLKHV